MKRILTIILAVMMIMSVMTACGGRGKDNATPTPSVTTPATGGNSSNNGTGNTNGASDGKVDSNGSGDGIIDDAGDAIHDAGNAVEDAVDDVLSPDSSPAPTDTARNGNGMGSSVGK